MICGKCKSEGVTTTHVRECYQTNMTGPVVGTYTAPAAPAYDEGAQPLPNLDRAYYAITLPGEDHVRFFRIDQPSKGAWAGYIFIGEQASDDVFPVRNQQRRAIILDTIKADPQKALSDYGKCIGKCGICHRTLTDPESIALGIGPICLAKGW